MALIHPWVIGQLACGNLLSRKEVLELSPAVNSSQAQSRGKAADKKLKQWVRELPLPLLQGAAAAAGVTFKRVLEQPEAGWRQPPTIVIHCQPLIPAPDNSSGTVGPTARLEFGAHSTGEPHGPMPITCEAATLWRRSTSRRPVHW